MANHKPLFLYHADLRKLLNKSDKTVYRTAKAIRIFFNLNKGAPIGVCHFAKFYDIPEEDIIKRLNP